ncbi:MAG: hypothetical protein FJZ63_05005, partial [Chlamydiae bacterium]|nr:hypothetical protein [Chlamydiota bacterium]
MEKLDWHALHKQLQETMKEELTKLRELLGLLKQEENVLLQGQALPPYSKTSPRYLINKQLKLLQKRRSALTRALGKTGTQVLYIHHFNSKNFNVLIAQDEDNAVETFSLRDQILSIMKIVRQYKERLDTLSKHPDTAAYVALSPKKLNKAKPSNLQ